MKYKEQILYIVFGFLTTAINLAVYFLARAVKTPLIAADIIAWIVGVVFAYVTNRKYVFQSTVQGDRACIIEMISFVIARLISLGIDIFFLVVTVKWLGLWEVPMKLTANVIVIIANYVFSKFFVFRDREKKLK